MQDVDADDGKGGRNLRPVSIIYYHFSKTDGCRTPIKRVRFMNNTAHEGRTKPLHPCDAACGRSYHWNQLKPIWAERTADRRRRCFHVCADCYNPFVAELQSWDKLNAIVNAHTYQPCYRRWAFAKLIFLCTLQVHRRVNGEAKALRTARHVWLMWVFPRWKWVARAVKRWAKI